MEGPIHTTVEPCLAFIKRNIALGSQIGEIYRQDRWEYPLEAICEAVTNAIIHRDYSIHGSDIKVAIFDDMLEITSPGPSPDYLPPDALGTGRSEIRNRLLAPIFKELKLIEAWGTGIQKMRTEVANYPDIQLVLQEAGHAFQVKFMKMRAQEAQVKAQEAAEESQEVLSKVEKDILEACQFNDQSGSELLAKTGYTTRTSNFKNTLTRLLEQRLLEMIIPGKPRSSKQQYRLTELGRGVLYRLTTKDKRCCYNQIRLCKLR